MLTKILTSKTVSPPGKIDAPTPGGESPSSKITATTPEKVISPEEIATPVFGPDAKPLLKPSYSETLIGPERKFGWLPKTLFILYSTGNKWVKVIWL